MAPGTSNGTAKIGAVTAKSWRSGGKGGGRSSLTLLKLLAVAGATYVAVYLQFGAIRTLQYPRAEYHEVEFEPPGARRWGDAPEEEEEEEDVADEDGRGDGAPQDGHEDASADVEDDVSEVEEETPQFTPNSNLRGEGSPSNIGDEAPPEPKPEQLSPSRRVPRTVAVDPRRGVYRPRPNRKASFEEDSLPEKGPTIQPDWYEPNADEFIDGYDWSVCEPMHEWQMQSFPNCNHFHELDVYRMRVINTGGSRIALEMRQQLEGEDAKFVFKTVKYHKEVTMKLAEEQRKDSLVMERTSSSRFIPDVYGYCSLGVMMDFMPEGNMHDYIKGARLAGGSSLSPVDRLRLSIHIATSVADLHTIDNTPMPSFFHNDICCHQYLFHNGVFKLNDFNYARPIYINKKTNEQCTRRSFGMAMWKARSLEEHQTHARYKDFVPVKPDKIDVWMMGNLIYYMLTDRYTFEKPKNLTWKQAGRELLAGRRSHMPEAIAKSDDPSHVAMKKALDMCWTQDHRERPTARSISDYLIGVLKEVTGDEEPDFRVKLPERDPNQGSSESDYERFNDW